jgi:hypothetical protein
MTSLTNSNDAVPGIGRQLPGQHPRQQRLKPPTGLRGRIPVGLEDAMERSIMRGSIHGDL